MAINSKKILKRVKSYFKKIEENWASLYQPVSFWSPVITTLCLSTLLVSKFTKDQKGIARTGK